jgi:hypothetical protein
MAPKRKSELETFEKSTKSATILDQLLLAVTQLT